MYICSRNSLCIHICALNAKLSAIYILLFSACVWVPTIVELLAIHSTNGNQWWAHISTCHQWQLVMTSLSLVCWVLYMLGISEVVGFILCFLTFEVVGYTLMLKLTWSSDLCTELYVYIYSWVLSPTTIITPKVTIKRNDKVMGDCKSEKQKAHWTFKSKSCSLTSRLNKKHYKGIQWENVSNTSSCSLRTFMVN